MALPSLRQSRVTAGCIVLLVLGILVGVGMCAVGTFTGTLDAAPQERVTPTQQSSLGRPGKTPGSGGAPSPLRGAERENVGRPAGGEESATFSGQPESGG
jgi:hypothetical protein